LFLFEILGEMNASNNSKLAAKKAAGVNIHLYSDDHPETTLKGTGFKDAETAHRTIELVMKHKPRNRQIWTINAMYHRAKHHPNQTASMREAMKIFQSWVDDYKIEKGKNDCDTAKKKKTTKKKRIATDEQNDLLSGNTGRIKKKLKRKESIDDLNEVPKNPDSKTCSTKAKNKPTATKKIKEKKSQRRLELEGEYKVLFNETLPKIAKANKWPLFLNHCLMRVALDAYWQCCWYEKLDQKKGALKSMTIPQIENVMIIGEQMSERGKSYVIELNQKSLSYRGKEPNRKVKKIKTSIAEDTKTSKYFKIKKESEDEKSKPIQGLILPDSSNSSMGVLKKEPVLKAETETEIITEHNDNMEYNEDALLLIQPATSGRASCKGCREKIMKGEHRVGMQIWSSGRQIMVWHHPLCFLQTAVRVEKLVKNSRAACKYSGRSKFTTGDLRLVLEVGLTKNYYYAPIAIDPMLSPVFRIIGENSKEGDGEDEIPTPNSLKGMDELEVKDRDILLKALSSSNILKK